MNLFKRIWSVLSNRRGSQTIEYVAVMAGAALLAMTLTEVMESNEIQNALREKIECVITQECNGTQVAFNEKADDESGYIPDSILSPLGDNFPESHPSLQTLGLNDYDWDYSWEQMNTSDSNLEPPEDEGFLDMLKRRVGEALDELPEHELFNISLVQDTIEDLKEGNFFSLILRIQPGGVFQSFFKDLTGFDIHGMWMNNPGSLITILAGGLMTAFPPTSVLGIGVLSMGGLGGLLTGIQGGSEGNVADAILFGGLSGALGFGAGLAAFRGAASIGTNALRNSPWLQRWIPIGAGGGVGGAVEDASLSLMTDGKVNWKQALAVGALGAVLGVGGGYFIEKAAPPVMNALKGYGISVNADGTLSNPFMFRQFDEAAEGYSKASGNTSARTKLTKKELQKKVETYTLEGKIEKVVDSKGEPERFITYADGQKKKVVNGKYARRVHPETGVPFNDNGFPVFDEWNKFDYKLDKSMYLDSDKTQFKKATAALDEYLKKNPDKEDMFTPKQLNQIRRHKHKIDGLTWHHHEEPGKLQLVPTEVHAPTTHTGGRAIWGGGEGYRKGG